MSEFIKIAPGLRVRAEDVCAVEEEWNGPTVGTGKFLRSKVTIRSGHVFFTQLRANDIIALID